MLYKPYFFRLIFFCFLFINIGCVHISYFANLASHQAKLLRSQIPVSEALDSELLNEKEKELLLLSKEVLSFCEEIGLKTKGNYTDYVYLENHVASYVVHAADSWGIKTYYWSYPIVGRLPYKGFPKFEDAKIEKQRMQSLGFDALVRRVSAYSTLGWFKDPIFSSLLQLDEEDFVEVLIHEILHLNIFVKNEADFNEQLATLVGSEGAKLFYIKKYGENHPKIKSIENNIHDATLFANFISKEIDNLKQWYYENPIEVSSLSKKQEQLKAIQSRFSYNLKPKLKTNRYDLFSEIELNNARLMLYGTYMKDLPQLKDIYKTSGLDLKDWIKEVKKDPKAVLQKLKSQSE